MANGRALVSPPPFTPLQFGLLSAAVDLTTGAPSHWEAGITWQSHCPDASGTFDPCLIEARDPGDLLQTADPEDRPTPAAKDATTGLALRGATPFAVYARMDCSPVGFWDRAQTLAEEAITRVEGHQIERLFATGEMEDASGAEVEVVFPHLQADDSLVDSTGAVLQTVTTELADNPVDVVEGIGLLERALADCYHGQGVLHVPSILGAHLAAYNLTTRRGAQLSSPAGHAVALGSGYPGEAPDGAAVDGVAWIYATGQVFFYRSAVTVHRQVDAFDRGSNTLEALAERRYVLGWDCCHFAVPVTTGGVEAGEVDGPGPIGS